MAIEALSDIRRAGVSAFTPGGSGSMVSVLVTVTPSQYQVVANVSDVAATATSKVICQFSPNADWDADDLADFTLFAEAKSGSIDFTICRPGPIVGDFLITYTLG